MEVAETGRHDALAEPTENVPAYPAGDRGAVRGRPSSSSAPAHRRRGAVTPAALAARTGREQTGPSPMELAAANYTHIRSDLVRIAILAVAMLAVIVVLSFVLR